MSDLQTALETALSAPDVKGDVGAQVAAVVQVLVTRCADPDVLYRAGKAFYLMPPAHAPEKSVLGRTAAAFDILFT